MITFKQEKYQITKSEQVILDPEFVFELKELSFLLKLRQIWWARPRKYILRKFVATDDRISVMMWNGDTYDLTKGQFTAEYSILHFLPLGHIRLEIEVLDCIKIKTMDERKIKIVPVYTDWNQKYDYNVIINILGAEESKLSKAIGRYSKILAHLEIILLISLPSLMIFIGFLLLLLLGNFISSTSILIFAFIIAVTVVTVTRYFYNMNIIGFALLPTLMIFITYLLLLLLGNFISSTSIKSILIFAFIIPVAVTWYLYKVGILKSASEE